MTKPINLEDISERFRFACKGLDYERAVVLGGITGELITEVKRLQKKLSEIESIYHDKSLDDHAFINAIAAKIEG